MAAVLLACLSAVLFGAMTVALRFALRRNSDAEAGSLVTVGVALVICLLGATTDPGNLSPSRLWPFFVVGLVAPGVAQLLFTRAIREAGASRVSVTVGAAPLISVTIALVFPGRAGSRRSAGRPRSSSSLAESRSSGSAFAPRRFAGQESGSRSSGRCFSRRATTSFAGLEKCRRSRATTAPFGGDSLFLVAFLFGERRRPPLGVFVHGLPAFFLVLPGVLFEVSFVSLSTGSAAGGSPSWAPSCLRGVALGRRLLPKLPAPGSCYLILWFWAGCCWWRAAWRRRDNLPLTDLFPVHYPHETRRGARSPRAHDQPAVRAGAADDRLRPATGRGPRAPTSSTRTATATSTCSAASGCTTSAGRTRACATRSSRRWSWRRPGTRRRSGSRPCRRCSPRSWFARARLTASGGLFTNSGTESVEAAIKLGRAATGRSRVVSVEHGFHGLTLGSLSANGGDAFTDRFEPLLPGFSQVPFNDLDALEAELRSEDVALFIVEPILGHGVRLPEAGYLEGAQALCRRYGTLFCVDEVQTGFGRTGRLFAFEHWGSSPT